MVFFRTKQVQRVIVPRNHKHTQCSTKASEDHPGQRSRIFFLKISAIPLGSIHPASPIHKRASLLRYPAYANKPPAARNPFVSTPLNSRDARSVRENLGRVGVSIYVYIYVSRPEQQFHW